MACFIRVKNWDEYQHYKDRHAPWIKFYGSMLTSHWWVMGDDDSKLLAVCIMALAQRTNNKIPADPEYIRKFSHISFVPNLELLKDAQFIEFIDENNLLQNASTSLASCYQGAPRIEEIRIDKKHPRKARSSDVSIDLPDWIPIDQWNAYVEMRKFIKAPLSGRAVTLAINELAKLREKGNDPALVLDRSVMNNWKGLFEIPKDKTESVATNDIFAGAL